MLRDEAVDQVKEGLNFRTDLDDKVVKRMLRVQRLLEMGRTLPWFLLRTFDTTIPLDDPLPYPADFIRENRDPTSIGLSRLTSEGIPIRLTKMDSYEAVQKFGVGDSSSTPMAYYLGTANFNIVPASHAETPVKLEYYFKDDELTTNIENLWLKHIPDIIIGNAGASLARTLKNTTAYDEFTQLATFAWQSLFNETIEKKIANRQYVLGRNS